MKRRSPFWLAVVALTAAAFPVAADVAREASERTVEAAGLRALRISNPSGRVEVRPATDGRLHVKALKILRGTAAERARLSAQTRVETASEQGVFTVRVFYRQRARLRVSLWDLCSGVEFPRSEVQLILEVPAAMPVQVSSSSGDVETTGLEGPQEINTSSGDVGVHGARGPVEATSSSGDIDASDLRAAKLRSTSGDVVVENVRGPLTVRASSGDVTVRGAEDSLSVGTVSGDIEVERAPRGIAVSTSSGEVTVREARGTVSVESSSGNVEVDLRAPLARARLSTSSGGIRATLGAGIACALDLRTSSGTLDVAVPVRVSEASRHSLSAVIGRGTVPVTLRSTSGDIHVASGGD